MLGSGAVGATGTGGLAPSRRAQGFEPALQRRGPARLPQLDEDGVDLVRHLLGALPALAGVGAQGAGDEPLDVRVEVADHRRGLLVPRAPDLHEDVRVGRPVEGLLPVVRM